jgi:uncharacterized protein (DUF4415 family)
MDESVDFSEGKRGAVIASTGKTRITIHIDDDVLEAFRAKTAEQGKGYQTLINDALRLALRADAAPVTLAELRQVLREELHAA